MSLVDVHILTMPDDNKSWFDQCLLSLEKEPVNIYICPGIVNDIGNARADAFMKGGAKYVSFVDPDDYVLSGGFVECVNVLEEYNLDAVYTSEIKTGQSGEVLEKPYITHQPHHIIVFRRGLVLENISFWRNWKWPSKFSEGRLFIDMLKEKGHQIGQIKKPFYVWRRHHLSYTIKSQLGVQNG